MNQDQRNKQIEKLFHEGKLSLKELGSEFGLSPDRVRVILRERGINTPPERALRRRGKLIEKDPLSKLHVQIGQDIAYYRSKLGLGPKAFAAHAGMSKERLRAIELGIYNLTLVDLAKLAKIIDVPMSELTTLRTMRI